MRWMFCRNNPANNINFGYGPADEIRNRFFFKLWNTYAFFCNYARLDGFDPLSEQIPPAARPDIDRWILSDLQLLVETARRAYENYDVMAFCLTAETYVAEKLSNWYVRRNRRRFWKSEKTSDKLAAYQTLHTALTTLTRLLAPITPFVTEEMYQNLEAGDGTRRERSPSVHLCDFPAVDPSLIDAELSADMEALLRLVSLGLAARNSVRIKVRQPLSQMKIIPGSEAERRAIVRFADQISEELNVKNVHLHASGQGPLLEYEIKANLKTLGPRLGQRVKEAQKALAALDAERAAEKVQAGGDLELNIGGEAVMLSQSDLLISTKAPQGWAGIADGRTQVALDTRITDELACEGIAREIVRHIQELRKQSGLEIEDRIRLHVGTNSTAVRAAIETHQAYIRGETLALELTQRPLDRDAHKAVIELQGQAVTIALIRTAWAAGAPVDS
jgi:isoleucyl-tRNA synthetase